MPGIFFALIYFIAGKFGDAVKAGLQISIRGNVIAHLTVMEFFIGNHIKIAGAGQPEEYGFFLSALPAAKCFVNSHTDGVAGFGSGQDAGSTAMMR